MVTHFEAALDKISIHKIGNKGQDEHCRFSEKGIALNDELLSGLLMQYFLHPFEKINELYRLYHPNDNLLLNEMYHFAIAIFTDPDSFHENSIQIAKHLYEVSTHPKIKLGELYVVYFKNLQIEGDLLDAIGLFKSENKETYLKVSPQPANFSIDYEQEAINIKKLDKGCLLFNTDKEEGFKLAILDQTNKTAEAVYWLDDFLKVKVRNDNYSQTANTLSMYKNFVTQEMEGEFALTKTDKIDLLNRSIKYFKEKDTFDVDEFANEVIDNTKAIDLFKTYKSNYEEDYDTPIGDSFSISDAAVKKQSRAFKSVLKLDKNFHIYIHGNNELIQKGTEDNGRKFYKIYYENEQ